jgi:uncharacterized protein YdhG (YjbR/CyaY superfamily)
MITTPQEYLESLDDNGREWLTEFFNYMSEKYPEYPITMFRQRPMYKKENSYLKGYLMFTASKSHFAIHTLQFDIIEEMKSILSGAQYGKGCVKIKYKDVDKITALKEMCDKVIASFNEQN